MHELHTMADFARDTIIGVVLAAVAFAVAMGIDLWRNRKRLPAVRKGQTPNPPPAPPLRPKTQDVPSMPTMMPMNPDCILGKPKRDADIGALVAEKMSCCQCQGGCDHHRAKAHTLCFDHHWAR